MIPTQMGLVFKPVAKGIETGCKVCNRFYCMAAWVSKLVAKGIKTDYIQEWAAVSPRIKLGCK